MGSCKSWILHSNDVTVFSFIHFLSPEAYLPPPFISYVSLSLLVTLNCHFSDEETLNALLDVLKLSGCGESITTGELAIDGTTLCCAGTRIPCETTQRCLMLWTVSHSVLCQGEKGERSTPLAVLQRVCLELTEHASRKALGKVANLKTYLGL